MTSIQFGAVQWFSHGLNVEDGTTVRNLNKARFSKRFKQPVCVRVSKLGNNIVEAEYWDTSAKDNNQAESVFSKLTKHRDESMDAFLKRLKRTLKEVIANPSKPTEPLNAKQMDWLGRILRR